MQFGIGNWSVIIVMVASQIFCWEETIRPQSGIKRAINLRSEIAAAKRDNALPEYCQIGSQGKMSAERSSL